MKKTLVLLLLSLSVGVGLPFKAYTQTFYAPVGGNLSEIEKVDYRSREGGYTRPTFWTKNSRAIGITAWHMSTVFLGAVGDGLNHRGDKEWGHTLKALEISMALTGPFVWKIKRGEWAAYLAPYAFHRLAEYDMWWNMTTGQDLLYNGDNSLYDKGMNTIPDHGKAYIKGWSFGVAIVIPFNEKL